MSFIATLVQKIELIPQVFLLTFGTDQPVDYKPGQFVSLEIGPKVHRAYSIAHLGSRAPFFVQKHGQLPNLSEQSYLTLIVSTKPGGLASGYFDQVQVGASLKALSVSGRFGVRALAVEKMFICTGTGLAPFVPMISQVLAKQPEARVKLFFGALTQGQDFSRQFFPAEIQDTDKFQLYSCIDGQEFEPNEKTFAGRVTEVVPKFVTNWQDTEFYLCGNPLMVSAMEARLKELEVPRQHIVKEAFGSIRKS